MRLLEYNCCFKVLFSHLPATPPAVSACCGTLTDGEGKWLLAGALIVSLTSGKIEDVAQAARLGLGF